MMTIMPYTFKKTYFYITSLLYLIELFQNKLPAPFKKGKTFGQSL